MFQRQSKENNYCTAQAYKYDVLKDNWNVLTNNCSIHQCWNLEYNSDPKSHFHPINIPEGSFASDYSMSRYYPFLQLMNDGVTNISTECSFEARFCPCLIELKTPKELDNIQRFSTLRVGPKSLLVLGGF